MMNQQALLLYFCTIVSSMVSRRRIYQFIVGIALSSQLSARSSCATAFAFEIPATTRSRQQHRRIHPAVSSSIPKVATNVGVFDSEEESDYVLQTEDYSILNKHDADEAAFDDSLIQKQHHPASVVQYRDDRVPKISLPKGLSQPGNTRWNNHHRATAKLMRGNNKQRDNKNKPDQDNQLQQQQVPPPIPPDDDDEDEKNDNNSNNPRNNNNNPVSNFISAFMNRPQLVSSCQDWKRLEKHAEYLQTTHLRDLLQDATRASCLFAQHDGVYLDYSRQRVSLETMTFLFALAEKQQLMEKIQSMVNGSKINFTEERAVLHTALRASKTEVGSIVVDGVDVVAEVHDVLDQIKTFTDGVRNGKIVGYTGKHIRNVVSVGIGGSYLGTEFLHECLKTEPEGHQAALGYTLRFLSNVDPVDVERTCADLDPEETMIVIVSKTFTTAETMLNARTMRQWLWDFMGNDPEVVRKHVVACASISALDKVDEFGIDTENYFFRFWDWVGGRYSVSSAVGGIPISLVYGFDIFEKFLRGAKSIDEHFTTAPLERNIPVLMGLLGVWNHSFLKYKTRTCLPYSEALLKLPAHIQQLDMESNGKSMTKQGLEVDYEVGEIDFGEAGTNGQHSFYQLLHMGQTVPCDFIGFVQSQHDYILDGENLSSHDELMANFFAQPDALATGKTVEEVRAEGVPEDLIAHKVFKGNRPSLSLLFPKLTAYTCGQILAIYEHRTAVQGFMWDINSFDQWGVELGKKLALDVKNHLLTGRQGKEVVADNPATTRLLNYYLQHSNDELDGEEQIPWKHNPTTKVTRTTHLEHLIPPWLSAPLQWLDQSGDQSQQQKQSKTMDKSQIPGDKAGADDG